MRIAEIAPVWVPVPPPAYGGIELVVSLLADGLSRRGHEVTLFAASGSTTDANLISPVPEPRDLMESLGNVTDEVVHALPAYRNADQFDVIHDHTGLGSALGAAHKGPPPVVHTLHGPWTEQSKRFFAAISPPVQLIAISEAQAAQNSDVQYAGVVHNAVDVDVYPWQKEKEDFLVFLGRCNPEKGPEIAVDVAKRAGLPLVMMMKRFEPHEQEHWDKEVAPRMTGDEEIRYDVGHDEKCEVLARAKGLLFPIQWSEPFGLVMIEAMACGTPVLAMPGGAAPEVVADGETGFLTETADEMVEAVGRLDEISPTACRERVTEHFSADVMVSKTERILEKVAAGR